MIAVGLAPAQIARLRCVAKALASGRRLAPSKAVSGDHVRSAESRVSLLPRQPVFSLAGRTADVDGHRRWRSMNAVAKALVAVEWW